jgi:hypothetical protein
LHDRLLDIGWLTGRDGFPGAFHLYKATCVPAHQGAWNGCGTAAHSGKAQQDVPIRANPSHFVTTVWHTGVAADNAHIAV